MHDIIGPLFRRSGAAALFAAVLAVSMLAPAGPARAEMRRGDECPVGKFVFYNPAEEIEVNYRNKRMMGAHVHAAAVAITTAARACRQFEAEVAAHFYKRKFAVTVETGKQIEQWKLQLHDQCAAICVKAREKNNAYKKIILYMRKDEWAKKYRGATRNTPWRYAANRQARRILAAKKAADGHLAEAEKIRDRLGAKPGRYTLFSVPTRVPQVAKIPTVPPGFITVRVPVTIDGPYPELTGVRISCLPYYRASGSGSGRGFSKTVNWHDLTFKKGAAPRQLTAALKFPKATRDTKTGRKVAYLTGLSCWAAGRTVGARFSPFGKCPASFRALSLFCVRSTQDVSFWVAVK